jgi:hypothetical protein
LDLSSPLISVYVTKAIDRERALLIVRKCEQLPTTGNGVDMVRRCLPCSSEEVMRGRRDFDSVEACCHRGEMQPRRAGLMMNQYVQLRLGRITNALFALRGYRGQFLESDEPAPVSEAPTRQVLSNLLNIWSLCQDQSSSSRWVERRHGNGRGRLDSVGCSNASSAAVATLLQEFEHDSERNGDSLKLAESHPFQRGGCDVA